MRNKMPSVLLIGEKSNGSSHLTRCLDTSGCECSFASSCREAFLILRKKKFDLVLSPTILPDGKLYSIMNLLEGSHTTVFYSYAVENSCWWLPALRSGQKCFGSPAFRPSEFVTLLEETIKQIHRDAVTPRESPQPPVSRADVFVMPILRSRVDLAVASPTGGEKQELAKHKAAG
jgi:PleD family two-component response regulator